MRQKIIYSTQGENLFVSYTFDDHPVVHVELKGSSAELSRKYQFAIKELEVTIEYLKHVSEILQIYTANLDKSVLLHHIKMQKRDEIVAQGLFSAATSAYGKLFMGVGQGRRQFKPNDFFTKDGKKFEPLHSWWMDVRNRYIAHAAGEPYDEAKFVLLLSPLYVENDNWYWCFPHVRFHRGTQPDTMLQLISMTEFMLELMQTKQHRVIKHIASKITPNEIALQRKSAVYASICNELPPAPMVED